MLITEITSPRTGKSLTIFDIDDTLFRTTAKIKVVRDGKPVRELTNQEFNSYVLEPGESFDFGEFRSAEKFNRESLPIKPMIAKLKAILNNAGDNTVIMLTARADFDDKELFLKTFAKYGIDMSKIHVHRAGSLPGDDIPAEKKAVWVRRYLDTGRYDKVRLYDDSMSNLRVFNGLKQEYPQVAFEAYFVTHEGSIRRVKDSTPSIANMRNKEITDESLTTQVPYNVTVANPDRFDAEAVIGDRKIIYGASPEEYGEWWVAFLERGIPGGPKKKMTFSKSGSGHELKVFSFVIAATKELIDRYRPHKILFTANKKEENRIKLYDRLIKRFPVTGYTFMGVFPKGGNELFVIQRNDTIEQDKPRASDEDKY